MLLLLLYWGGFMKPPQKMCSFLLYLAKKDFRFLVSLAIEISTFLYNMYHKGKEQQLTIHFLSLSRSRCGQFLMTCLSREYSLSHSGSVGQSLNTQAEKQDVCRVWICHIGAAQRHKVRMLQDFLALWFLLPVWVTEGQDGHILAVIGCDVNISADASLLVTAARGWSCMT